MDFKTLAQKRDMTYDFYLKHNMAAFEWKLNDMHNKDKNLINNDILLIQDLVVIGIIIYKKNL